MIFNILRLGWSDWLSSKPSPSFARGLLLVAVVICMLPLSSCGGGAQSSTPRLTIVTGALPNGVSGTPYAQSIATSGGVAPYRWEISRGTLPHNLTLASNSDNVASISGTPDLAAQAVTFSVKVSDSALQSAQKSYTVSILLAADSVTLSSENLDFGLQLIGTSSVTRSETLINNSSSNVAITGITISGTNASDYSRTSSCGANLAGGGSCAVNLVFTPAQIGPSTALVQISDDTAGSPHSFSLNGLGGSSGANVTLSATILDFGNQATETTSAALTVSLSNYGTAKLNVSNITASSPFHQTNSCGSSVTPGATCTISVTFAPTSTGTVTGTVLLSDNASGSPSEIDLTGTGVAGACVPKGAQCRSGAVCCAGLSCVASGNRHFCE
jgi:hypothetical protein